MDKKAKISMRMVRRRFIVSAGLAGAGIAGIAMAGCGGSKNAAQPTAARGGTPTARGGSASAGASPGGAPRTGGILIIKDHLDPHMDPRLFQENNTTWPLAAVFRGLVSYD